MTLPCTVLGAGSWGTALAIQLARRGHDVALWDHKPDRCDAINATRKNPDYLRDCDLPDTLFGEPDLTKAIAHGRLLVPVVPSHALRAVMTQAAPHVAEGTVICCATKGIEDSSLQPMHTVLDQTLAAAHHPNICVLSGPSFALEVGNGMPTAVVVAGQDDPAHLAADAFHGSGFRAYHTEDIVGACIGGSLKNVMAIACGVSDGIGLGSNARAAIITRGLAEITRLAVSMGANPLTMMGLAGMGDLVLTCTGDLSRNRRVGLGLGAGKTLPVILDELGQVAEGVITARSAKNLGEKLGIDLPITQQVYALLYEDKPAADALQELLGRRRKAERL